MAPRANTRTISAVEFAKGWVTRLLPLAHGETGNAFTELVTFSKGSWSRTFENNGFDVVVAEPMNLFYTGWCVLGRHLPIPARHRLARLLGSACWVYRVRPR